MVGGVVASRDGLTRVDGGDERRVDITVVVVVTDHRILFLSGEGAATGTAPDAGSLAYDEIGSVVSRDGLLDVSTVEGTRWRFSLADADPEASDAVARHVGWIGTVRSRVVACRNDVDLAVEGIREAASARDWESAAESYERARQTLDDAIGAVQRTEPIADGVLAPELTELERSLEAAYATTSIERADSRLTLGQQLVDNENHEQARTVLQSARADYDRVRSHVAAVRRGDDFVFGRQRKLEDRLERLEWEIEAVSAEPLRQAHAAKIRARSATDAEETVEQWETAFRRYRDVLELEEGDDGRHFASDLAAVREELSNAAGQLVGIRHALARNEWDEGVECHREDDTIGAILRLDAAVEHVERAHEIAREFRPDAAARMEDRLGRMQEGRRRLRESGGASRPSTSGPEGTDPDGSRDAAGKRTGEGDEATGITARELADLDTHHDITFTDDAMIRNDGGSPTARGGVGEDPGEGVDDDEDADGGEGVNDHSRITPRRDRDGSE